MANPEDLRHLENEELWNNWLVTSVTHDLSGANLSGRTFDRYNFAGVDIRETDFSDCSLKDTTFCGADGIGSNFRHANCSGADFTRASLDEARFMWANLIGSRFIQARMPRAVLDEAKLINADLSQAMLEGASLTKADMTYVDLTRANLRRANCMYVKMCGATLQNVDARGALLQGAVLDNANISGIWLFKASYIGCSFKEVDCSWLYLDEYGFCRTIINPGECEKVLCPDNTRVVLHYPRGIDIDAVCKNHKVVRSQLELRYPGCALSTREISQVLSPDHHVLLILNIDNPGHYPIEDFRAMLEAEGVHLMSEMLKPSQWNGKSVVGGIVRFVSGVASSVVSSRLTTILTPKP